jgi:hypothetical protein
LRVVAAGGDLVDSERDACGEDAVDDQDDPGGERRVDAEDAEVSGEDEGVERGDPGSGSAGAEEGVGVSAPEHDGAGDAAKLPAELEVVEDGAEAIGVREGDVEDANDEAHPEDAARRAESDAGMGEEDLQAGEHAASIVEG